MQALTVRVIHLDNLHSLCRAFYRAEMLDPGRDWPELWSVLRFQGLIALDHSMGLYILHLCTSKFLLFRQIPSCCSLKMILHADTRKDYSLSIRCICLHSCSPFGVPRSRKNLLKGLSAGTLYQAAFILKLKFRLNF